MEACSFAPGDESGCIGECDGECTSLTSAVMELMAKAKHDTESRCKLERIKKIIDSACA